MSRLYIHNMFSRWYRNQGNDMHEDGSFWSNSIAYVWSVYPCRMQTAHDQTMYIYSTKQHNTNLPRYTKVGDYFPSESLNRKLDANIFRWNSKSQLSFTREFCVKLETGATKQPLSHYHKKLLSHHRMYINKISFKQNSWPFTTPISWPLTTPLSHHSIINRFYPTTECILIEHLPQAKLLRWRSLGLLLHH
jgi:hypothetical protein